MYKHRPATLKLTPKSQTINLHINHPKHTAPKHTAPKHQLNQHKNRQQHQNTTQKIHIISVNLNIDKNQNPANPRNITINPTSKIKRSIHHNINKPSLRTQTNI